MKIELKRESEIKLFLSSKETDWLKTIMQNPINSSLEDETNENRQMRMNFWRLFNEIDNLKKKIFET